METVPGLGSARRMQRISRPAARLRPAPGGGGTEMSDDSSVPALVAHARDGDKQAWDAIVERYAPLIWAICRRYRLDRPDADDVGQSVWLRLVDQLPLIRDPAALPGWIATTTRRECGRLVSAPRRREVLGYAQDVAEMPDPSPAAADAEVLVAERNAVLREAVRQLPPRCQELIGLLIADPPVPYADISGKLGIPVCNTPDYGTREVADHAIALMMTLAKSIAYHDAELHADLRGNWRPAHNPFGRRLSVCTYGVVGMGRIGTAAARRAKAFDMDVVF